MSPTLTGVLPYPTPSDLNHLPAASSNAAFQPRKYTTCERDANGSDEATFRRYHGRHARFDQPDPYDGSYDLTDPQSLNRYAYTQNDPVNFVDPSGLNLESGGGGTNCWFNWTATGWYVGDERVAVTDFKGSTTCYGGPGGGTGEGYFGGGGGGGQSQPPRKQNTFTGCKDFVNYLLSLASLLNIPAKGTRHQSPTEIAAEKLGLRMMAEAFDYSYISSGTNGFRRELTQYGQGAGVYGHILLQAGAMLEGWGTGTLMSGAFRILDYGQRDMSPSPQRNAEAVTEIEDNKSGRRVGRHMQDYLFNHKDVMKLKTDITNELCGK